MSDLKYTQEHEWIRLEGDEWSDLTGDSRRAIGQGHPPRSWIFSPPRQSMAIALIIAFIAGLGLLLPSLYLLFRLFLFDKDYVKGKSDYHA